MAQVKIILTAPHTHAGTQYQAGDTLECDELSAKFIINVGAGKPATARRTNQTQREDINNGAQ